MFDRFSSISKVFITSCLGVFILVSSACGPMPTNTPSQAIPTCTSASLPNPYRLHPPPNQVTNIFSNYKSNAAIYDNVRQDAFIQLGKSIKQWSDYEDVMIDGRTVRITITYLDPMLVQFVVLNEALLPPNNLMDQNWFNGQIQTAMDRLANRNEIMFMVAISSPLYENAIPVQIPIASLELISTSGRRASPTHYDPILGERNDVSQKPVHGYVGYPVSLLLPGGCTGVVDQWTTSLKLDYKASLAQDHPFYSLFWNIPYESLVVIQGNSHPVPTINPLIDKGRYSKSNTPPPPDMLTNDDSANDYWEEMGRYIWSKVIMMDDK